MQGSVEAAMNLPKEKCLLGHRFILGGFSIYSALRSHYMSMLRVGEKWVFYDDNDNPRLHPESSGKHMLHDYIAAHAYYFAIVNKK